MKILVIGAGGREHALAWKLAQSSRVSEVFVAPGNAGTATEEKVKNVAIEDSAELIRFCQENKIDITVVGPEKPLANGIVDEFRKAGLTIFGPTQYSAQLESSKDFAKQFMQKYEIPTANYVTFIDVTAAQDYVSEKGVPIVIKADGLASGKGVVVATTVEEANKAITEMLVENKMGGAGAKVVIEDFLTGVEASFIVMVDGEHILPLATSQDHKRLLDGDNGPNTGGMGAYSPAPVVTESTFRKALRKIIEPAVRGMKVDGHPFTGFLYAGLMIDEQGDPYTIEFNCRLGDPETQPIMIRLESDLVDLLEAACAGTLNEASISWDSNFAVGVVLAAKNYPQTPLIGDKINGLNEACQLAKVFHAGTTIQNNEVLTNGGRVLCVVGVGEKVLNAKQKAYDAIEKISFEGMQFRHDIADKAIFS